MFSLKDWEISYRLGGALPDSRASFECEYESRIARIYLSDEWDEKPCVEELKRCAFHEVCELLLADYAILAENRYGVEENAMESAKHAIIRRLENYTYGSVKY